MTDLKMRVRAKKIAELRELAAQAREETFLPGWPYGGCGPAEWADAVDGILGGVTGAYCSAVHPDLLVVVLDELERLRAEAASGAPESAVSESLRLEAK